MIHLPKQMKHLKIISWYWYAVKWWYLYTIIKENEEKEKTMELDGEEDVNDVNIVDLID